MNHPRKLYMLHCSVDGKHTYYSNGISCLNIPFEKFTTFEIQLITIQSGCYFLRDRFPALVRFQKAWRCRLRWLRAPKRWLSRQESDIAIRPPPFLEEVTHHESDKHLLSSFLNSEGQ